MRFANRVVCAILESPAHRLLSGSTDVVRYTGQKSGREFSVPTQYARLGDDVVIFVARPETKNWWHNFRAERELEVLIRGSWRPMRGRAVVGTDEPEAIAPLIDAYVARFPKAARLLEGNAGDASSVGPVIVWCRPR